MSNFIRPKKPVSEQEKNETARLFGDLVAKLDTPAQNQEAQPPATKKDEPKSNRFFGFKSFLPR